VKRCRDGWGFVYLPSLSSFLVCVLSGMLSYISFIFNDFSFLLSITYHWANDGEEDNQSKVKHKQNEEWQPVALGGCRRSSCLWRLDCTHGAILSLIANWLMWWEWSGVLSTIFFLVEQQPLPRVFQVFLCNRTVQASGIWYTALHTNACRRLSSGNFRWATLAY